MIQDPKDLVRFTSLGKTLAFPLRMDKRTGKLKTVEGEEAVKQSIRIILQTALLERVMREDEGVLLPRLLFANIEAVKNTAPAQAVDAVSRYEPRVKNVTATATVLPDEPNTVYIDVQYVIRATGTRDSLVYPYFLDPAVK